MVNLDIQSITNEIDYFGDTITLRTVTDSSYSKWGDASESALDTTGLKAFVQILTQADDLVKEGVFQSGDKLFWFKGDQANLSRGNRIIHDFKTYEIIEVLPYNVADTTYVLEIRTKKV